MTQCNQIQFTFAAHNSRKVIAQFEDNRLTTDGGGLLLRQADRGSDEVRTRLDLNAKFQEDAAQNFCSGCIKAYQER